MNRGIAKRTLFEDSSDVRYFLSRLARAVRRGQIEIHVWSILTTHYHLLVRSPLGELSAAMRRVQLDYSRKFNRARKRDGPLVRGRFRSKPVESLAYRRILVRYIDSNPVRAGLTSTPAEYPYGSARWFARRASPPWHQRGWVEDEVRRATASESYAPSAYDRTFSQARLEEIGYLVERRLDPKATGPANGDLLGLATKDVLRWMQRKARLADGTTPGLAVAAPQAILAAIAEFEKASGSWRKKLGRQPRDAWMLLRVGLLRDLAGASWDEIGRCVGRAPSNVSGLSRLHVELLRNDGEYASRAADLAGTVMVG